MTAKAIRRAATATRERPQPAIARRAARNSANDAESAAPVSIRLVRRGDLEAIVSLDAHVTGVEKRDYWRSIYRRYGEPTAERQFLVAESGGKVIGFVIGELRDWEFGSPRCGWVFAIDVHPDTRLSGTGARLFEAICAGFRRAGVRKVRTMLARDNTLVMSFFRSRALHRARDGARMSAAGEAAKRPSTRERDARPTPDGLVLAWADQRVAQNGTAGQARTSAGQ
jgi:N-acetylglutamate synthase-like GNAT family acetyltransferase